MKIYLATWLAEKSHGEALTKMGASQRLLSYFFIEEQKVSKVGIETYCQEGILDPKEKQNKINHDSRT